MRIARKCPSVESRLRRRDVATYNQGVNNVAPSRDVDRQSSNPGRAISAALAAVDAATEAESAAAVTTASRSAAVFLAPFGLPMCRRLQPASQASSEPALTAG